MVILESNPGRQDGRRRRIHWAMVATQKDCPFQVKDVVDVSFKFLLDKMY